MSLVARVAATLEEMAAKRLEKQDAMNAARQQPGGGEGQDQPNPPDPAVNLQQFQTSLKQIGNLKSWLVKSLSLCFKNPLEASKQFRSLAGSLCGANAGLASVLDDLGVSRDSDDVIDFGSLGEGLEKMEKQRIAIAEDLQAAGPIRKMRGRPFGSKNVEKPVAQQTADGANTQDAQDGAETKATKNTKGTRRPTSSKKKPVPEAEVEMADPPESTDPFAEDEEKKKNKSCTISLYSKCLVVETAKKLQREGNHVSIEKEVMSRFKKYFYSPETERWKTGLLSKWTKRLVRVMGEMMPKTNQIEDIPRLGLKHR